MIKETQLPEGTQELEEATKLLRAFSQISDPSTRAAVITFAEVCAGEEREAASEIPVSWSKRDEQ